eukprot:s3031_g11.t1
MQRIRIADRPQVEKLSWTRRFHMALADLGLESATAEVERGNPNTKSQPACIHRQRGRSGAAAHLCCVYSCFRPV